MASPKVGQPSTASSASTSPSASPAVRIFESSRYGYRVEVPPGWVVNEYDGSWESLSQFTPGGEIPGEDAIAPPGFGSFLVMNSMEVPTARVTPGHSSGGRVRWEWLRQAPKPYAMG